MTEETADEPVRTAEIIGTLCLATDLGMGFPFEHGLHSTLIAMRLADALGVDRETAVQTYYACLLLMSVAPPTRRSCRGLRRSSMTDALQRRSCSGPRARSSPGSFDRYRIRAPRDRHGPPRSRGACHGSIERHAHLAAICEVAEMLAEQTGAPGSVRGVFDYLLERWDGRGPPGRARGEDIPCRCGSSTSPSTPPSSGCSVARSSRATSWVSGPAMPSIRRSSTLLTEQPGEILAVDRHLGLG